MGVERVIAHGSMSYPITSVRTESNSQQPNKLKLTKCYLKFNIMHYYLYFITVLAFSRETEVIGDYDNC